jgi:RNase P subunit RPR2
MKRQLCKRCNVFLKVDSTCLIREDTTESKQKRLCLTCQQCGFVKTYLMNTKHKLWLTDPRSDVAPTKDLVCTKKGKKIVKPPEPQEQS